MRPDHHADDATLIEYGAGTINEGFSLVLAAHAEMCRPCRDAVNDAEAIGGELVATLSPEKMNASGMNPIWERIAGTSDEQVVSRTQIKTREGGFGGVLSEFFPGGLEAVRWQPVMPGIKQHILKDVDCLYGSVRLLQIDSGVRIPEHSHSGSELTLLLSGSYKDETGHYQRGDLADLDSSVTHQPVVDSSEPCICLIATDDKLRFSGVFSRLLQPIIGI